MKYISPGSWFLLEYPAGWHEFEDTEDSFLFYNPEKWNGNFRISAFKGQDKKYAEECMDYELKNNRTSRLVKVGEWSRNSLQKILLHQRLILQVFRR